MTPASHSSDEQLDAATWCRHLLSEGSVYAFLADHRQHLFPPELFVDVARQGGGHPSVPAGVIATVMVLQALEGLSDREAVSALRRDGYKAHIATEPETGLVTECADRGQRP